MLAEAVVLSVDVISGPFRWQRERAFTVTAGQQRSENPIALSCSTFAFGPNLFQKANIRAVTHLLSALRLQDPRLHTSPGLISPVSLAHPLSAQSQQYESGANLGARVTTVKARQFADSLVEGLARARVLRLSRRGCGARMVRVRRRKKRRMWKSRILRWMRGRVMGSIVGSEGSY